MLLVTLVLFVFGACIGSFLNVVILRYLSGETLGGRSHCVGCNRQLAWWELVPIFSWLALRGKCYHCHRPISVQYMFVEIAMGAVTVLLATPVPLTGLLMSIAALKVIIAACLVVLFMIDFYTFLLPDRFIMVLSVAVVALQVITTGLSGMPASAAGALLGSGLLFLLWLATRGRGIGLGDVKLMIPLGWLFGLWPTLFLLWLAFIAGGVVSLVILGRGRATLKTAVPFGPFLAGVAILLLLAPNLPVAVFSFWLR